MILKQIVGRIGVQRATWFYPSTTLKKFYPVDPLLAYHLERAYHQTKPFDSSYGDELRSALEIGPEGEAKLKHTLPEVGVDVIFQSSDSARVYARNLQARLSKSFLTSFIRDKAHSGGGSTTCFPTNSGKRKVADLILKLWCVEATIRYSSAFKCIARRLQ